MLSDELVPITLKIYEQINDFWKDNLSSKVISFPHVPVDVFEISAIAYEKMQIKFGYDRSTVGIYVKIEGEYIPLKRLNPDCQNFGFKAYIPKNLQYNFEVLDKTLKEILANA